MMSELLDRKTLSAQISSAQDSPVRTSASRAEAMVFAALEAAFSSRPRESFASFARHGLCSKTPPRSYPAEESMPCSTSFPATGMMLSGRLYKLQTSELRTAEPAHSLSRGELWPTPTASDSRGSRRHGYMLTGNTGTTLLDAAECFHFPHAATTPRAGTRGRARVRLNPEFCEALMGLPVGWTKASDFTQLAML